jgi:phospholipid/cholesterol/gamma-HCH transport system ATP-binding protein
MTNTYHNETVIEVKGLHKDFAGVKVLHDVSLFLNRGENLVVLGRSGTGKSVLIKCLVRLIWPDAGDIRILGQDVLALSEEELNRLRIRLGYLFQESALYDSMSLLENLLFPLKRHRKDLDAGEMKDLVRQALESVGLAEAYDKMPSELSGGMRKRAGLARALILNPEIIFYDEPTTGLDPYTSRDISELIVRIQEMYNASSIIVTHDMKCAETVSDRVCLLHQGQFIAMGRFHELLNHEDKIVKDYFI